MPLSLGVSLFAVWLWFWSPITENARLCEYSMTSRIFINSETQREWRKHMFNNPIWLPKKLASIHPSNDSQLYWHHTADAVTAVHSTALCSSKHQRDQRKEELECKIPTAPGPATESWFTYKWNQRTGHLTSEQWRVPEQNGENYARH